MLDNKISMKKFDLSNSAHKWLSVFLHYLPFTFGLFITGQDRLTEAALYEVQRVDL